MEGRWKRKVVMRTKRKRKKCKRMKKIQMMTIIRCVPLNFIAGVSVKLEPGILVCCLRNMYNYLLYHFDTLNVTLVEY